MTELESWFEITNGDRFEQGDVLVDVPLVELQRNFPWPIQNDATVQQQISIHAVDAIIMSQSCDLMHPGKLRFITFCRVFLLEEVKEFTLPEKREDLRKGRYAAYHLLNKCAIPGHERGFMLVEFKTIFSLPSRLTRRLAQRQGDRLRLKSPYKEHLAQAFARYFMRVGLPLDIAPFENSHDQD